MCGYLVYLLKIIVYGFRHMLAYSFYSIDVPVVFYVLLFCHKEDYKLPFCSLKKYTM